MAANVYECMVIFDPNKYAQDPGALSTTIPALVTKLGGEVLVSRLWNEQKLAYPMDGHRKGTYWLTYLRIDSQKLTEMNREMRINESILRSMTIKIDPRLVEPLVEHAKGNRAKAIETADIPSVDIDIEDESLAEALDN